MLKNNFFRFFIVIITFVNFIFAVASLFFARSLESRFKDNEYLQSGLPFKGVLKDPEGNPIDYKVDVRFSIYDKDSGGEPLYVGECLGESGILPGVDGTFKVELGKDCGMAPLSRSLVSSATPYFIGVSINENIELTPRFKLGSSETQNQFLNMPRALTMADGEIESEQISLKATNENTGNIILYPAPGRNTVISNGNLGLGVFDPSSKISIEDYSENSSLSITKRKAGVVGQNKAIIDLSFDTDNKQDLNYVSFKLKEQAGEITKIGEISVVNDSLTYQSSGADFAEYFNTDTVFRHGLIVSVTNNGYRPAEKGDNVIGVVTDKPGFVGNIGERDKSSSLIGLVGQVEVLFATQRAEVKLGDPVSVSFNGFADIGKDNLIGYSLENIRILESSKFTNCSREVREYVNGKNFKCGSVRILLRF